jgi:hypothetical protein
MGGRRRFTWLFGLSVLALALAFYQEFILDGSAMLYGDDMINEGFQLRSFGVEEVRSGRGFPLWNPFVYGGQPYLAILPGPVFYPSTLLYLLMPLYRAIGWTFVLHTFLAGMFGYTAARSIRLERVPSAVAGLAFMFTGFVVSTLYGGHDGRMFAMVLIPLAFTMLERGLASGRLRWFLGMGLVVALQIFTPHIQLMYYSSLALSLYAAMRIGQRARSDGARTAVRLIGLWALAFGVAGLVGAAQLLPTLQILDVAVRGGAGESGYAFASSWALPPQEFSALLLPDLIGSLGTYWGSNPFKLHTEYLGAAPAGLVLLALTTVRRDRRVMFLAVTALVCVLFALGSATPVHRIAYHTLPFVKQFRAPSMMLGPATLMVALLAGLGWQRVLEMRREERVSVSWAWALALATPLLIIGLAAAFSPDGLLRWARTVWFPTDWTRLPAVDPTGALRINGWFVLAGVGGALGTAWAVATRRAPEWTVALLLLVLVADGWRVNGRYLRTVEEASVFPSDPVIDHLRSSLSPGERVFPPGGMTGYGPSELSVHGIPTVTGIQKFRLEWYERFTGGLGMQNVGSMTALGLLDVKYLVAGGGLTADALAIEAEAPRGSAYRVVQDVPHAFFPRRVEATADTAEALRRVLSADPLDLAVVAGESAPEAGEGVAMITRYEPNELVIEVEAARGGLLFVSEVYYPAWRAWVDGEPAEILRTNTAFRGVVVPTGAHSVRLRYSAAEFRVGFAVSGLSGLAAIAWLLLGLRGFGRPGGRAGLDPDPEVAGIS